MLVQKKIRNVIILFKLFDREKKYKFFVLIFLMVAASFFEILTISSVIPLLGIFTAPEYILQHKIFGKIFSYFNIKDINNLMFLIIVSFSIIVIFGGLFRVFLINYLTKYSHLLGADFSSMIYKHVLRQNYQTHLNNNSSNVIGGISKRVNDVVGHIIIPSLNLSSTLNKINDFFSTNFNIYSKFLNN